ncbi:hypothetical protein Nepgr_027327 [Nepenthes gracilis]|uniref:Secreted protein n=1 Tax=Nepenthes gracilis TaxID=150966 RepID=A0AAD3Y301_NEPGR|nr:hypothetical protein Nepgr_027327 [Nepenthes gracilis]
MVHDQWATFRCATAMLLPSAICITGIKSYPCNQPPSPQIAMQNLTEAQSPCNYSNSNAEWRVNEKEGGHQHMMEFRNICDNSDPLPGVLGCITKQPFRYEE